MSTPTLEQVVTVLASVTDLRAYNAAKRLAARLPPVVQLEAVDALRAASKRARTEPAHTCGCFACHRAKARIAA